MSRGRCSFPRLRPRLRRASGSQKVALPRTRNGIAVFSMGSLIPESEALEFESAAQGESHTWRATREFALLGEILGSVEWGALDLLMFDLPPGAERTVQYADFLGPFDIAKGRPRVSFLLVTIPSEVARGVVARSVAALSKGSTSPPRLRREHERLLLPRLQCHQAALWSRPMGPSRNLEGSPASGPSRSIPSSHGTAIGGSPSRNCPTRPSAGPSTTLRSSFWTSNDRSLPDEVPLRPLR